MAFLGCLGGAFPIIIDQKFMKLGFWIGIIYLLLWFAWIFLTLIALTLKVVMTESGIKTYSLFSFLNEDIAWADIHDVYIEWPLEQLIFYSKRWKKKRIIGLNALDKRLKDDIMAELQKRKLPNHK
jgi:hypothetical protein